MAPAPAPAAREVLVAPPVVYALPVAAAASTAPAAAGEEAFEAEGCGAVPLFFSGAIEDVEGDEDRHAGYCLRFAQAIPPTWRAKDAVWRARSPMGQGCPFVVQWGVDHIAQRAETTRQLGDG